MRTDTVSGQSLGGPPWLWPRAAYIHIPFCRHHCGYCDFAVVTGQDDRADAYLDALEAEMRAAGGPHEVETVFIGGGTPTHLSAGQLARLLRLIREHRPFADGAEVSVESTPDSLDAARGAALAEGGVTRVSVGVQSFRPGALQVLDRRHGAAEIPAALERVRESVGRFSLDLIFGVPGQSLEGWHADLDAALAHRPDHVSTYGLTYEKGTPLWKQRRRGEVIPLAEDDEAAMYEASMERLPAAGLGQYEISNFARPGARCRHNEVYWANEAYWGFGLGAARYVNGSRELNTRSLPEYLRRAAAGEPPTFQSETLPPEERAYETAAIQLRRAEGVDRSRFAEQTGFEFDPLLGDAAAGLVGVGLLEDAGGAVRLTRRGRCVADGVVGRLMRR